MFNDESYRNAVMARGERMAMMTDETDLIAFVPCGLCGTPTRMTGTKRCDRCWELERRIQMMPDLAQKILGDYRGNQQPTQPALDGGEWRVEAEPVHGWRVIEGATGRKVVGNVYYEEDARQIVAEHNAVSKLVEALQRRVSPTKCYCEAMLGAKCGECADRELLASLAATITTPPDAGERQER